MTDHTPAEVLTRMLHAIDVLDWPTVRRCLADELCTDYTELFGGEPQRLTGDQLVENWRGLLPGFDATQHLTGPVLVSGRDGRTRLDTHVRAYHRVTDAEGGPVWAVHGHYEAVVDEDAGNGRRISELTLRLFYEEGNTGLVELASERAVSSPRVGRERA